MFELNCYARTIFTPTMFSRRRLPHTPRSLPGSPGRVRSSCYHAFACVYVCMCVYIYIYVCVFVCLFVYLYTYIYIYIYICIYTHLYIYIYRERERHRERNIHVYCCFVALPLCCWVGLPLLLYTHLLLCLLITCVALLVYRWRTSTFVLFVLRLFVIVVCLLCCFTAGVRIPVYYYYVFGCWIMCLCCCFPTGGETRSSYHHVLAWLTIGYCVYVSMVGEHVNLIITRLIVSWLCSGCVVFCTHVY